MYDVIVVGGGSAGAAVAARLSEDSSRKILLLEAGLDWRAAEIAPEVASLNPIPVIHNRAFQEKWQWPDLHTRRIASQDPHHYWRGKGLGGSSMMNGIIAIRGVALAFDEWASLGCTGWSADEIMPLFSVIEDDLDYGDQAGHGRGGPLPVFRMPRDRWGPVDMGLRDSAVASGYNWIEDVNGTDGEGVAPYPINCRQDLRRVSTNEGYLEPARGRANLEIRGKSLVERVIIRDGKAVGVVVRTEGQNETSEVFARDVVLSGGAIHSPAILMRSGVGPAAHLKSLGIDVVRDLPVGENFFDHPLFRTNINLKPEFLSTDPHARHTNCCVTYTSGLANGGPRDMIWIAFNHRGIGKPGAIGSGLYNAFSRGSLKLRSADAAIDPIVDENMLDDPRDMDRLVDAVKRLGIVTAQKAFAEITESVTLADSDIAMQDAVNMPRAELEALLRQYTGDIQHAAGTCRMTGFNDANGVVNPDGTVKGIANLRVADASIMPTDCRANTHLTTVVIGEKIARTMRAAG